MVHSLLPKLENTCSAPATSMFEIKIRMIIKVYSYYGVTRNYFGTFTTKIAENGVSNFGVLNLFCLPTIFLQTTSNAILALILLYENTLS